MLKVIYVQPFSINIRLCLLSHLWLSNCTVSLQLFPYSEEKCLLPSTGQQAFVVFALLFFLTELVGFHTSGGFLHLIKHPVIALVLPYGFMFHYFSMSLFLCISFSFCPLPPPISCFFSLCSLPSQQKTHFSTCPPDPRALQTH